ncbi:MAG: DUF1223 domain-containing protein [Rugosibacter sp.]
MDAYQSARLTLVCLLSTLSMVASAASNCVARSGAQRTVLLELYTSEGCNSCPPADQKLSQIKHQKEYAGRIVPLAFHVDYWDSLGWMDRFANPQFTRRQYAMASLAQSRLVYTPQFLRNGSDWRSERSLLDNLNKTRPGANIVLDMRTLPDGRLAISGEVNLVAENTVAEAYLAVYENNLESQVHAGENFGKTLHHDYVVRRLIGPLPLDKAGHIDLRQDIALDASWKRADLGMAVFVQNKATGEILQALQHPACPS